MPRCVSLAILVILLLLMAAVADTAQVSLTWTNPTLNADGTPLVDLDHINLYRCLGANCVPSYQRSVGLVSSLVDNGLAPETVYSYQVAAVNTGGLESERSNVVLALTPTDPSPTDGFVAAYGFNEGGGLAVGDAMGGPTGLISGAVWTTSGRYGSALTFDGVNDRVTIQSGPSLQSPLTAITVSAWIRPNGTSQPWASILQKVHAGNYLSYAIAQDTNNTRRLRGYLQIDGQLVSTPATKTMANRAWSAAVLTWASGAPLTLTIYRANGSVFDTVSSVPRTGTITYDSSRLLVGEDEAGNHWKGTIDEVQLYDRQLSLPEIHRALSIPLP